MSLEDIFYGAAIATLCNITVTLILAKLLIKKVETRLLQSIPILFDTGQQYIEAWLNTENAQKAIYQIGGIIGSGAAAGAGIQKGRGKLSIKNLIGQLIGGFIQQKMGTTQAANPETATQIGELKSA